MRTLYKNMIDGYEAFDGKRFNTAEECRLYEHDIVHGKEERLKKYRTNEECMPLQWGSFLDNCFYYEWFKVNSRQEYDDFCEIIGFEPTQKEIPNMYPEYICAYDLDLYDTCGNENVISLQSCMNEVSEFFNKFGCTVKFERKENNAAN